MIFLFFSTKVHMQHIGMKISTSIHFTITDSEVSLSYGSFLQSKLIIATRMEKFELSAHPAFVPPLHLCPKRALFLFSSLCEVHCDHHTETDRDVIYFPDTVVSLSFATSLPRNMKFIVNWFFVALNCRTGWNQSYQDMIISLNACCSIQFSQQQMKPD